MFDNVRMRATRYGWRWEYIMLEPCGSLGLRLTSPLGAIHDCTLSMDGHDILTAAVFDAWIRQNACSALLEIARNPQHSRHAVVCEWLADAQSRLDPWPIVRAEGAVIDRAPVDVPLSGFEGLYVDGDKGRDLRPAMQRCLAMRRSRELQEVLAATFARASRARL